ncbi:hypothetical protein CO615_04420 [Lysobacteraceae bacterium NML75-0749]|nr:hypothetical protein CO615_04420 [Xanthomonadaceae bacterium NML75-0749]
MSKQTFEQRYRADVRLIILKLLADRPGEQSNSGLLYTGLDYMGVTIGRADLIADLEYLEIHQLVELEQLGGNDPRLYSVRMLEKGKDFLAGNVRIDGVSAPARQRGAK